jgi:hypothetical protein
MWFDDPGGAARGLERLLGQRARRRSYCLRLARPQGPGWPARRRAALTLRRRLEEAGHACTWLEADEWGRPDALTADVAVAIGWEPGQPCAPAQLNVLLAPDRLTEAAWAQGWDVVGLDAECAGRPDPVPHHSVIALAGLDARPERGEWLEPLLRAVEDRAQRPGMGPRVRAAA